MMTKVERKNKDVAGYQILYILATIDGDFDPREGRIIEEYIEETFPHGSDLDGAFNEFINTKEEDYPLLFQKCAEDFYAGSTEKERLHFIEFTLKLIKADHMIDSDENWMLNKLYQYWDL